MIKPLGDRVVLKRLEAEETTKSGAVRAGNRSATSPIRSQSSRAAHRAEPEVPGAVLRPGNRAALQPVQVLRPGCGEVCIAGSDQAGWR